MWTVMSSKSYLPCKSMPKKSHQTEHSIKRKKKFQRIYNSSQERVIITNKYMKMNLKISLISEGVSTRGDQAFPNKSQNTSRWLKICSAKQIVQSKNPPSK